jgi:outer membrane receptor protein involved in Fe transport
MSDKPWKSRRKTRVRFRHWQSTTWLSLVSAAVPLAATAITPVSAAAALAGTIDEITVSAMRREMAVSEISTAVSTVAAEAIRAEKLITDALREAPGIFVQQTTPGQGAAIIRGLKGSSVLHMVDGMRLNNAIFRSAPTQYFALVPTMAIERIEVLRGTPASLYGSDAVGGVVQAVTHVPVFDSEQTRSTADIFALLDSAEQTRSLRARVDIGNRKLAASASLEHLATGDRKTGGGDRVVPSDYEQTAGRIAVSATPDDKRSWFVDVHFLEQPETPRSDELVPGFGQTEPSSSEFLFKPNRRLFAHARYMHTDGTLGLDWRADLSFQRIDDDRVSRDLNATQRTIEENSSGLTGFMVTAARSVKDRTWIAGVEYYHDKVASSRQEEDIVSGIRRAVTARFPDGSTIEQAALFWNSDFIVNDSHAFNGGLRFSRVDVELADTLVSSSTSIRATDLSGDLGWRYDATPEWQLVANAGFGFRAPNVFDLGTLGNRPGNRFNVPNTTLDSERVVQLDTGVRRRGEGWQLEASLFALQYDDRITSVSTGEVTPQGRDIVQSVNAAESRIHGMEAGFQVALTQFVEMQAVINYTRGRQRLAGPSEASESADRIPPLGGHLNLNYDAGKPLSASMWLRFADRQDRLSARDIRDSRIDPNGTPGWATAGAQARWHIDDTWQLTLGLENLLDKNYRHHGSGIDATGRNVYLSAWRRW